MLTEEDLKGAGKEHCGATKQMLKPGVVPKQSTTPRIPPKEVEHTDKAHPCETAMASHTVAALSLAIVHY